MLIVVNSSLIIFTDSQCQCSTTYTINKHYGTFTNHTIIRLYAECSTRLESNVLCYYTCYQGRIQDFKLGGSALKKIAPSGGRRENFWGISCEQSRFYAKRSNFIQLRREARKVLGISYEKSRFYAKKSCFFQF